jgi:hypothetical protein
MWGESQSDDSPFIARSPVDVQNHIFVSNGLTFSVEAEISVFKPGVNARPRQEPDRGRGEEIDDIAVIARDRETPSFLNRPL